MQPPPWYRVRLWLVSLVLFVGGIVCRIVLSLTTNRAYSYSAAVDIQALCYGAGLLALLGEMYLGGRSENAQATIFAILMGLSVASFLAVVSSIPK